MKATQISLFAFLTLTAMLVGCATTRPNHDDEACHELNAVRMQKIGKAVRDALMEDANPNSADWCWAVIRDAKTGEQLFSDGMVHDLSFQSLDVASPKSEIYGCGHPITIEKEIGDEINVACLKTYYYECIYPVEFWQHYRTTYCVEAAGSFPADNPQFHATIGFGFPVELDGGAEAAKILARSALGRLASGMAEIK